MHASRSLWHTLIPLLLLTLGGCDASDPAPTHRFGPAVVTLTPAGQATEEAAIVRINGALVSGEGYATEALHDGPVYVRAGVPFEVVTATFGNPSTRMAPSTVETSGRRTVVSVFDGRALGFSPAVLRFLPRTDRVTFAEAGPAEVVVRGSTVVLATAEVQTRDLRFPVVVTPP